jgi:hemolysin D
MSDRLVHPDAAKRPLSAAALAFAPGLLAIQERPPAPLAKIILITLTALVAILIVWACFGKLDIIATAPGRLVPASYVKIVQPSGPGILREILVREGEHVQAGQVLLRMDRQDSDADSAELENSLRTRELQIRRIDAELGGQPFLRRKGDRDEAFRQVQFQFEAHRQAYGQTIAQAEEALRRSVHDREAGEQTLEKLKQTTPIYRSQAQTYADLGKDGYVPRTAMEDKQREFIESDQELKSQTARVASLESSVGQAQRQLDELKAKARSDLQNERVEAEADRAKLAQELLKQAHHSGLLELKAEEAGTIKDLATHSIGTVVTAGTVLVSLVPEKSSLVAEVTVRNEDVGFVSAKLPVKVKVASYPFQQYGMVDGKVAQVWPDAVDAGAAQGSGHDLDSRTDEPSSGGFKALIDLSRQSLRAPNGELPLVSGMRVVVEINQGRQTVMEYLLSPILKVAQEGGHER